MTVTALVLPDGTTVPIEGIGYAPVGAVPDLPEVRPLVQAAAICNDARLQAPVESGGPWQTLGDPTEIALVTLATKAGADVDALRRGAPASASCPSSRRAR
jgi:magnesium-transporting ATPase (P-type)